MTDESRTERDKMLAGELYRPSDPEIQAELAATASWLARYNLSLPNQRRALLRERLGDIGPGGEIRPPFFWDHGFNIRLGTGVFLNVNCVVLDVVEVTIGDGTQIGPAVQIYAADHPRDPDWSWPDWSWGAPSISGGMSGSAAAPSSCPAYASEMTRSSVPAAS